MTSIIKKLNTEIKKSYKYLERMDEPSDEQTPEFEDGYKSGLEEARRIIQNTDTAKIIRATIRDFVKSNYGQAEAAAPSWDIYTLAEAINQAIKGE